MEMDRLHACFLRLRSEGVPRLEQRRAAISWPSLLRLRRHYLYPHEAGIAEISTVHLFRALLCRQRKTSMVKGQQALAAGESGAAAQHFAKATTVTHQMAYELIKVTTHTSDGDRG